MKEDGKYFFKSGLFVSFLALIFVPGCDFKYTKVPPGTADVGSRNPRQAGNNDQRQVGQGSISFAKVQKEIFEPKCMNCHGRREPLLGDYAAIIKVLPLVERSVLIEQTMPRRGPLVAGLQVLLKTWIESGAPEFVAGPPVAAVDPEAPPVTSPESPAVDGESRLRPVRFSALKKAFLEPNCISCHYVDNENGLSELETHASVVAFIDEIELYTIGILGSEVASAADRMPPSRFKPPTLEAKALLLLWRSDGMKN